MHATQKAAGVVTSTRGPAALDLSALRQQAEVARQAVALAGLDNANAEASTRQRQVGAALWSLAQARRHIEDAQRATAAIVHQLQSFGQVGG